MLGECMDFGAVEFIKNTESSCVRKSNFKNACENDFLRTDYFVSKRRVKVSPDPSNP
jgi:hypothetical protein